MENINESIPEVKVQDSLEVSGIRSPGETDPPIPIEKPLDEKLF